MKAPISRAPIHTFALNACVELGDNVPSEESLEKYKAFGEFSHWVANILDRRDLVSRGLHGEASSVDEAA